MKKVISLLLCVAMLFFINAQAYASDNTLSEQKDLSQLPALEAYNALYSTFEMDEFGDYKIGYSTGWTSGTITSNYSDIGNSGESYEGMYIYGIIRTSALSADGDSGGPVFLAYSSGYGALGTVAATTPADEMMYSALRYATNGGFSLKIN